jgi:DNA polymerase IV
MSQHPPGFCRDCFAPTLADEPRCKSCGSPRLVRHAELHQLHIAHIDCDAFYAAVEKRDRPEIRDQPVIVGGATRGVVSTCCYIARIQGVRSAMPMFKALKLCPQAVVIKPDMAKYADVGKQVRAKMEAVTPLVQPISIDEAFLDLKGTEKLHGQSPALTLAKLLAEIERDIGITASSGLAPNKFLAKLASDMQKPKGFSVIGAAEAKSLLAEKPVGNIWGVGKAFQETLERDGITKIGQLQTKEKTDLMRKYGAMGARLYHLARGEDLRDVKTDEESKSVSAETTFDTDISNAAELEAILWSLAEKVSRRAKSQDLAGSTINLKLKTRDFKTRTRAVSLSDSTSLAHRIFDAAKPLLMKEAKGEKFRLLGVGISNLTEANTDAEAHSLDQRTQSLTKAELAIDTIRNKFGKSAVVKGITHKALTSSSKAGPVAAHKPKV